MTIAEIFLLLMFVMWLGTLADSATGDDSVEVSVLRRHLANAQKELAEAKKDAQTAWRKVEVLRLMLGVKELTPEELNAWMYRVRREAEEAARRGKPKCADDNVLLNVRTIQGHTEVSVISGDSAVLDWLQDRARVPTNGAVLAGSQLQKLLTAVKKRYDAQDCRFDYRLQYETAEDYRFARETFEQLFYPAGIKRAQ